MKKKYVKPTSKQVLLGMESGCLINESVTGEKDGIWSGDAKEGYEYLKDDNLFGW